MLLALDVGNSQIFGGVFLEDKIQLYFRYETRQGISSDQIGVFLKNVLRENGIDADSIQKIAICSVVPHLDYSLRSACHKYFKADPFFLTTDCEIGLKISYHTPSELGADRLADAIAAIKLYPNRNLVVVDFGTATTFCAITADKLYLGGPILPGIRLSMDALQSKAAKLFPVEIVKPNEIVGQGTKESVQAGLYYGQLGGMREIIQHVTESVFQNEDPFVVGTGGFSHLYKDEGVFDVLNPDLVLQGLCIACQMNHC